MSNGRYKSANDLPAQPLRAAAEFYERIVPEIRGWMAFHDPIVVLFDEADHTHDGWRLAAIQELAREAAPNRINAITTPLGNKSGIQQTLQFLYDSPGITGQVLHVDGNSGEKD